MALARDRGVRDVAVDSTFATPGRHPTDGRSARTSSCTRSPSTSAGTAMRWVAPWSGGRADIEALNLEATVHYGGVLSPFNAWLILRGAATFPIRMQAHQETAMAVAAYLERPPRHCARALSGPASHIPQHDLARTSDAQLLRHDDVSDQGAGARGGRKDGGRPEGDPLCGLARGTTAPSSTGSRPRC